MSEKSLKGAFLVAVGLTVAIVLALALGGQHSDSASEATTIPADPQVATPVDTQEAAALAPTALRVVDATTPTPSATEEPTTEPTQEPTAAATEAATEAATAEATEEPLTFHSIAELMDFLADDDPFLGPEDAPVVIVEFSDYACPYCGKFFLDTLPLILEAYPDDVKYVHRDYPIFGDISFTLAMSVDCAGEQDKFWEMHRAYLERFSDFDPDTMEHDGPPSEPGGGDDRFSYYTDENILGLAQEAGVEDLDSFSTCLDEQRYADEVVYDYQIGAAIGIEGVPFFVINGRAVNGAQSFEVFQQVIDQSLAEAEAEDAS